VSKIAENILIQKIVSLQDRNHRQGKQVYSALHKNVQWSMKPNTKEHSNFKPTDGEQNGTRIYQMMLKSMQILPVAENSKIALLENNIVDTASKGKRKARPNTIADEPPSKKVTTGRVTRKKASTSKDETAMETE